MTSVQPVTDGVRRGVNSLVNWYLFAGDAIVTRDPYTGRAGPRLVARAATADSAQNLRSLDALAQTGARWVLTGHGEPWDRGADEAVRLAREARVA